MKEKLVIIFPGIGYHCDKPLLYYAKKLAKEHGYEEIVSLKYSYTGKNIRGNEKKMQEACDILYQQAEKQLELIDFSKICRSSIYFKKRRNCYIIFICTEI